MKIFFKIILLLSLSNALLGQSEEAWMEEYFENSGDNYLEGALDAYESIDAIEDFDEIKGYKALSKVYPWMKEVGDVARAMDGTSTDASTFVEKGEQALLQKDFSKALLAFDAALKQSTKQYNGRLKIPINIKIYNGIAQAKLGQGKLEEAVESIQQSIKAGTKKEGLRASGQTKAEDLIYPVEILPSLEKKGQILEALYRKKQRKSDLLKALIEFEKTIDLMSLIRKRYDSEQVKVYLNQRARKLCESGIKAALQLHRLTKDAQYLAKAFSISEKGKSAILLDALMKAADQEIASVPDSLLGRAAFLKSEIEYLENRITKAEKSGDKQNRIKRWSDKAFQYQEELLSIQSDIENDYPLAERWQFDVEPASLGEIQAQVSGDSRGVLSYFLGAENAFLFVLTREDIKAVFLGESKLIKKDIIDFQRLFTASDFEEKPRAYLQDYQRLAFSIFSKILQKGTNRFQAVQQWTVFPDDVLWLLPFEILLTKEMPLRKISFSPDYLPYWMKDVSVNYAYSASVLLQNEGQRLGYEGFSGFAPAFEGSSYAMRNCKEEELGALKFNQKEIEGIQGLLGGEAALGKMATKNQFLDLSANNHILHIASHACVDTEHPLQSKIYFADASLTAKEIYDLKIKSPMVVLSACETGLGQLSSGEGMMSLARAFSYAGCPSVVTSLWSVSDASTSDLMLRFYEYLDEGFSKSQALRKAKLDYMESQDKVHQNPFYWAGFVVLGDDVALSEGSPFKALDWKWGALGLIVLLLVSKMFSRKK